MRCGPLSKPRLICKSTDRLERRPPKLQFAQDLRARCGNAENDCMSPYTAFMVRLLERVVHEARRWVNGEDFEAELLEHPVLSAHAKERLASPGRPQFRRDPERLFRRR